MTVASPKRNRTFAYLWPMRTSWPARRRGGNLSGVHPPSSRSLPLYLDALLNWWTMSFLRRPAVALSTLPLTLPKVFQHTPFVSLETHVRVYLAQPHVIPAVNSALAGFFLFPLDTRRHTPQTPLHCNLTRTHESPEHCDTRRKLSRTWLSSRRSHGEWRSF